MKPFFPSIFALALAASSAFSAVFDSAATATGPGAPPLSQAAAAPTPAADGTGTAQTLADNSAATPPPLVASGTQQQVLIANIARWHAGASIFLFDPAGQPLKPIAFGTSLQTGQSVDERSKSPFSPLLDEDPTVHTPIPAGKTRVVIDLGSVQVIQQISLYSDSADGSLDIYYEDALKPQPLNSNRWKNAFAHMSLSSKEITSVDLAALSARYIMLEFKLTKPGEVSSLGIFSEVPVSIGQAPEQPGVNGVPQEQTPSKSMAFDFGPSAYGSQALVVSGNTASAPKYVPDGNPNTKVTLDQGKKDDNVMVVDLGANRKVDKVVLAFGSKGKGTLDFFLVTAMPPAMKAYLDKKAATPKAALWRQADGRLAPLLLAADTGSLAEYLMLSQLAAADNPPDSSAPAATVTAENFSAEMAKFLSTTKPYISKPVDGTEGRITLDLDNQIVHYIIIQWTPESTEGPNLTRGAGSSGDNGTGSSGTTGTGGSTGGGSGAPASANALTVFQVSVIGQVPADGFMASKDAFAVNASSQVNTGSGGAGPSLPPTTGGGPAGPPPEPPSPKSP